MICKVLRASAYWREVSEGAARSLIKARSRLFLFPVRGVRDGKGWWMASGLSNEHEPIESKIAELYRDLFLHDGFGSISIEMRFLKRGQKEVIVRSGKDYRYVVDWPGSGACAAGSGRTSSARSV